MYKRQKSKLMGDVLVQLSFSIFWQPPNLWVDLNAGMIKNFRDKHLINDKQELLLSEKCSVLKTELFNRIGSWWGGYNTAPAPHGPGLVRHEPSVKANVVLSGDFIMSRTISLPNSACSTVPDFEDPSQLQYCGMCLVIMSSCFILSFRFHTLWCQFLLQLSVPWPELWLATWLKYVC